MADDRPEKPDTFHDDDELEDDLDEEASPDELETLDRKVAEQYRSDEGRETQTSAVFSAIAVRARERAKAERLSRYQYEALLWEIREVLDEFAESFISDIGHSSRGHLWFRQPHDRLYFRAKEWREASPVDAKRVDQVAAKYLSKPFLQHDPLDWMIVNALLFDAAARFADGVRSGSLLGRANWAYVFADGRPGRTLLWRVGLVVLALTLRWIAPPVAITWFAWHGNQVAALYVAVPWGAYLLFRLLVWPSRFMRRRTLSKQHQALTDTYAAIEKAWASSNGEVVNPTRLKELVVEAETKGAVLPAVIHALLDRAIQRDPAVLIATPA
jgi:hypothetical protein